MLVTQLKRCGSSQTWRERRADESSSTYSPPFMGKGLALWMLPVVGLEELRSKHLVRSFPRIVCCGVALPPYQVLQFTPLTKESMSHDGLDFIFFFSVDHLRWWLVEIDPVFRSFPISCQ